MGQNRMKFWLCHSIYRHRQKQTSIKTDRQTGKKGQTTELQTDRQTDKQTDRDRDIQRDRETESQTDRQTVTHTITHMEY